MTRSCSALGCATRDSGLSRERGISFHQFPVDALQRTRWIHAVNRVDPKSKKVWIPGPGAILCSKHFVETDFESYGMRRKLKKGAVPSVFQRKDSWSKCQKRISQTLVKHKQPFPDDSFTEEAVTNDHNYSLRSPERRPEQQRKMKDVLQLPEKTAAAQRRSLFHRQKKAVHVIKELVEKRLLSEDIAGLLQALFADLPWELSSKRPMTAYTGEMKQFACTLHLYSSKAYEYVRKRFPLPHPSSLTIWLSTDKATPGFSDSAFFHLQQRIESHTKAYQYCSLVMGSVALRNRLEWDLSTQQLAGFADLGSGPLDAGEAPAASESIIIMAVGVFASWRIPLGYFFAGWVSGHMLAQLLRQAVNKLSQLGITVLSVTSAATAHGVAAAKALGVLIEAGRIQCTFQHPPGSSRRIAYFFDACHLVKLIRNAFQSFSRLAFEDGTAEWQHVVALAALQEEKVVLDGDSLPGKLRKRPGYCLKLNQATQLFSDSVAGMLEHLELLGLPAFQDCKGTVKFVRLVSNLLEVFSSRNRHGKGLKGPVSAGTYAKVSRLLSEAKTTFVALQDSSRRRLLKGRWKLGFLGFLLNAESLKWLYLNYIHVDTVPSQSLLTFAFSLDHLEAFFQTLRQIYGISGNPTCTAFQAAYHKLLMCYSFPLGKLEDSLLGDTSTLDISLIRRRDLTLGAVRALYSTGIKQTGSLDNLPCLAPSFSLSVLSNALTELPVFTGGCSTTGLVAKKLAAALRCETCVAALFASEDRLDSDWRMKMVDGLSSPSECVQRIVKTSKRVLRTHTKLKGSIICLKQQQLSLEQKILRELSGQGPFFPDLSDHLFDGEMSVSNHYTKLLKKIVQGYLCLRAEQEQKWDLEGCWGAKEWKVFFSGHSSPPSACKHYLYHNKL
ncbi:DNA transposase THAP9 [Eublepharis macularius]|uniref:DNA transposase THAP9 n=1 Tax=Eublepharis macularius TaxID=481883 RepID=A0AA97JY77_EUBMA|nr:DNA transposase THAP9 [Eublepharis macularius]